MVVQRWQQNTSAILGGALWGLLNRYFFKVAPNFLQIMSVGFLALLPFSVGVMTLWFANQTERRSWLFRIFAPWIGCGLFAGGMLLTAWEGSICIVMILPLALVAASLGGVIFGYYLARRKGNPLALVAILVLPLVSANIEQLTPPPTEMRSVRSNIEIEATPEVVWKTIVSIPQFTPAENRTSWTHRLGFPKPLEATLDRPGVGGVRQARFAGGLIFLETINVWEPPHRLGFTIRPNTENIPVTTLDEHVTIGGAYFTTLYGLYEIETLPEGKVRLRLSSQHQLSTHVNRYSALWTDAIMQDIQRGILIILKNRAEAGGAL